MTIDQWTLPHALDILLNVNGKPKAGVCREDSSWYQKRGLETLREFIIQRTSFLNENDVKFVERFKYFRDGMTELLLCPHCNERRVKFLTEGKFISNCGSNECKSKQKSITSTLMHASLSDEKRILKNERIGRSNSGTLNEKYTAERADEIRQALSRATLGRVCSAETRLKMSISRQGRKHSEKTKLKISRSNSLTMNDPTWREWFEPRRIAGFSKQSLTMRSKIASGEFTPSIVNSFSRRLAYAIIDDVRINFRSSWEAIFFMHARRFGMRYEETRIPYEFEGKQRIYIIDFTDHIGKCLYEIKPVSRTNYDKEARKIEAGRAYARSIDYDFIVIDEKWFSENSIELIELCSSNPHLIASLRKIDGTYLKFRMGSADSDRMAGLSRHQEIEPK